MNLLRNWAALAIFAVLATSAPAADDPGLADLDEATQLKLTANTFDDLGKVADKCEEALKKGLDDGNQKFAKSLITSAMMQRASAAAASVMRQGFRDPRARKAREIAVADLERALKHDSKLGAAHLLMGQLLALPGGDIDKARKSLAEAVTLADSDEAKAEALVARAGVENDPAKRRADYDEAVKLVPKGVEVVRARGMYLFATNDFKGAETDLATVAELDAKNPAAHHMLGTVQLMLQKNDAAIGSFGKAIELAKDTPALGEYLVGRARAYAVKGDVDKALADTTQAIDRSPGDLPALLLRARLYQLQRDYDKAMNDVRRVLRQRPGLIAGIELRAAIHAAQGNFEEAIDDLELLRQENPKDKERLMQLGTLYQVVKRYKMAILRYDAVLAIDNSDFDARYHRADALLAIGKHVEAIADYEVIIKQKPDHTGVLNNLAWVLATSPVDKLRDGKRSIELGRKACELTQFKKPHIISTYAAGYAETGQWDEAIKWSQKAIDVCEDDDENKPQLLKELESYKSKKPWRELQNEDADENPEKKEKPKSKSEKPKSEKPKEDKPKDDKPKSPDPAKPGAKDKPMPPEPK